MYDPDSYEDDGQDEVAQASPGDPVLKIRAEGEVSIEYLVKKATEGVLRTVDEKIDAKVDEKLDAAVDAAFTDAIKVRVQAAVDEVLDKGFPKIDQYGRNTGMKPLAERVAEELGKRDQYGSRDAFERMVHEKFGGELDRALKPHVERAKAEFSAQVDGVLKARLTEVLRSALGLGR